MNNLAVDQLTCTFVGLIGKNWDAYIRHRSLGAMPMQWHCTKGITRYDRWERANEDNNGDRVGGKEGGSDNVGGDVYGGRDGDVGERGRTGTGTGTGARRERGGD